MSKRSYRQNCALARASDVIGERWTLLLLRDLLIYPRRFNELLASLKGIGTNLLASRLKDLEAAAVIERQPGIGGVQVYAVTDRGRALEPALLALIRWGLMHGPENQAGDHHRDDWDLLALKALFLPDRAENLSACVQFKTSEFEAWVRVADQRISVGLGDADSFDFGVNGTITDLFFGSTPTTNSRTSGDPSLLHRFKLAFALRA